MRKNSWLQKLLYCLMVVLGAYIIYKSGCLLALESQLQKASEDGNIQRSLEDSAMRTWASAYTAAVEGKESGNAFSLWMSQIAPVFSYAVDQAESGDETDTDEMAKLQVEDETDTEGVAELPAEAETEMETMTAAQEETETPAQETMAGTIFAQALPQLLDYSYLLSNIYTVDADTYADAELLDADKLLSVDLGIEQDASVPQILIYHTHSQEAFADSVEGEVSDTIVGMGDILADELRSYGYNVIHDTGVYDLVDGVLDRSAAYDYAREAVTEILEEYPTIEVVIDLHRDGVSGEEGDFVTEIDGESVSKIMFFNGLSRDENGDEISWLPNAYLSENLAFSLQLQVLANAEYPGFTRKIYLKEERYNLHLRARSLLIEAGTQLNTVEEEQRAMVPLANLIRQVLEM
ncbi:MAG: stage II sporulation protein P [Lachnospiraceae bacterium]|nr:stage II sporulation protein P [Lachnospiraceae bacterium]